MILDSMLLDPIATTAIGGTITTVANQPEEKREANTKKLIGTSLISGTTVIYNSCSRQNTMNRIHERSASEYVASMSDEELEQALIALGELEKPNDEIKSNKI